MGMRTKSWLLEPKWKLLLSLCLFRGKPRHSDSSGSGVCFASTKSQGADKKAGAGAKVSKLQRGVC